MIVILSWIFLFVVAFYLSLGFTGETLEEKRLTHLMIKRLESDNSEDIPPF